MIDKNVEKSRDDFYSWKINYKVTDYIDFHSWNKAIDACLEIVIPEGHYGERECTEVAEEIRRLKK